MGTNRRSGVDLQDLPEVLYFFSNKNGRIQGGWPVSQDPPSLLVHPKLHNEGKTSGLILEKSTFIMMPYSHLIYEFTAK